MLAVVRERAAQLSRDIERRCEAAAAAAANANNANASSWAPHARGLSATPRAAAIGTF